MSKLSTILKEKLSAVELRKTHLVCIATRHDDGFSKELIEKSLSKINLPSISSDTLIDKVNKFHESGSLFPEVYITLVPEKIADYINSMNENEIQRILVDVIDRANEKYCRSNEIIFYLKNNQCPIQEEKLNWFDELVKKYIDSIKKLDEHYIDKYVILDSNY